ERVRRPLAVRIFSGAFAGLFLIAGALPLRATLTRQVAEVRREGVQSLVAPAALPHEGNQGNFATLLGHGGEVALVTQQTGGKWSTPATVGNFATSPLSGGLGRPGDFPRRTDAFPAFCPNARQRSRRFFHPAAWPLHRALDFLI